MASRDDDADAGSEGEHPLPLPEDLRGVDRLRWERLATALSELDGRMNRPEGGALASAETEVAVRRARASYERARAAFEAGEDQVAWAHCHQGFRDLLGRLPAVQLEARRKALQLEAAEKLSNWRQKAVLEVLDVEGPIDADTLAHAQSLFDQHFANVYFKLKAAAIRFRILARGLLGAVAGILLLSAFQEGEPGGSFLHDTSTLLSVMAAGVVGALLSSTLSQMSIAGRIPDYLGGVAEWTLRPLLGAMSAVAVCVVVQSDLLPLAADTPPFLYGWAVAAGFSDQLLNGVMRRVEESANR